MKKRFMVYDRQENPLFDLDISAIQGEGAIRYEKLNGEHKLDITTTQTLQEGLRILSQDGTEKWREWVIDEPAETHEDGYLATYGCTWSMQYDLATVSGGELWPGTYTPITAGSALAMVLGVQSRWEVGNVTVSGTAGTTLYDGQVWDYLGKLQEVWGGEMEPRIVVDSNGIVHRYVDWLAHVGNTDAKRRFDYGEDCTAIRQKVDPGPRYCWVEPRGGKDATDEDGISYSERVGVEEEPADSGTGWAHDADSKYVRDPDAEADFKQPDGNGGWHYPTKVVIYDSDDPEELLEMAVNDLHEHTRPKTTYEADVLQFAAAGMDPHGVALGDEVQIVDKSFGDAPLRLEARIVEITVNELDETDVQLVIGEANKGLEAAFKSMRSAIDAAEERSRRIEGAGTIVYLQHLLDELNAEINASGGYSYVVAGEGIVVYDIAVDDPLVGYNSTTQTWAGQVVQIKGGNIRIANEKNASFAGLSDWKWKTVIVSGHIAAELVTAANIVAGFIGNASMGSYWDLDNGILYVSAGRTLADAINDAEKVATNYLSFNTSNGLDVGYDGTSAKTQINGSGVNIFDANGVSEALFTGTSARIGRSDKEHITITPSSGINMYDSSGSASVLFAGVSGSNSIVRVGKQIGSGNVVMSSEGYVSVRRGSTTVAHFGYDDVMTSGGTKEKGVYYNLGTRKSNTTIGALSLAEGTNTEASGPDSHAEGFETVASGYCAHAEGYRSVAKGGYSHAQNFYCEANADYSHASGSSCVASYARSFLHGWSLVDGKDTQFVIGCGNVKDTTATFVIGGSPDRVNLRNAFTMDPNGYGWCRGTITQNSDRRLKEHHAYLAEDAAEFVRKLRPALYTKDGERHVGFYAQNVQEAEPEEWDTATVTAKHTDESLDFDPLTLDYNALIAPLTAYAQQLERRVDEQQQAIDALTERLAALEARP